MNIRIDTRRTLTQFRGGWRSVEELSVALGVQKKSVRMQLQRLEADGLVERRVRKVIHVPGARGGVHRRHYFRLTERGEMVLLGHRPTTAKALAEPAAPEGVMAHAPNSIFSLGNYV